MLCPEVAFEHDSRCVSKRTFAEQLRWVELVLCWAELPPLGGKLAREWPWVSPKSAEEPVACQALLQLGVERRCELHCAVSLCSTELNCQPVHTRPLTDLWH